MSQHDLILKHLKSGKSITPIEALSLYGCFRLGARIFDIKNGGYEILSERITKNDKHFAQYTMMGA